MLGWATRVQVNDFRNRRWRPQVALVAACILILQALSSAMTLGGAPAARQLDAYGNPLCLTHADESGAPSDGDQAKHPNCCTLGCGGFSYLLAAPGGDAAGHRFALVSEPMRFRPAAGPSLDPDHEPGKPRAPPPTV